ncbi:antibiotic biosynthesis monooxygenase [Ochrobactrum sp. SFR4]|uniref:putative quinol monooxygenase n=1 Tax=Ochrobactrum sp. SFR4 TaxID=2717368 RepID=UPI001C8CB0EA|nr:antibiotic biosynthesis monooxygenase [Ochrobactrum sp. SFR4]MBX8827138.1 antibiotic biosynthesis monooxygenase [Ochrobactrum sp. SFR4]
MQLTIKIIIASFIVFMSVFAAKSATAKNNRIAIIVEYVVVEGKEDKVLNMLKKHATLTIKEEPGCLRFEVLKPASKDGSLVRNHIMVTELYANQNAAAAHAKKPRLAKLLSAIRPMLTFEKVTSSIVLTSPEH